LHDKKLHHNNGCLDDPELVQSTKSNRSKVVVDRIVDQVKKLKQQAPRMRYQVKSRFDKRIPLESHPYKLALRSSKYTIERIEALYP
jgi:hypothetical protein